MDIKSEIPVTRWGSSPPSYKSDKDASKIAAIAKEANKIFRKADEAHRDVLPEGASFVNTHLAKKHVPRLWGLEEFFLAYPPELMREVASVRLELNDYVETLGLGLVSVSIALSDSQGRNLLPEEDSKPPTLGSVLSPAHLRQQILALFPINQGCAEKISGDGSVYARTFAHNEIPSNHVLPEPPLLGTRDRALLVTEGSKIGVCVPVLDPATFERTRIAYQEVSSDRTGKPSQIYTCRNLTAEAALKIIRGN